MATLGNVVTILDVAKKKDPTGKMARIAEVLNKQNRILDDIDFVEGNLDTGHSVNIRTSIPVPSWVGINGSGTVDKATQDESVEQFGFLESWSEIGQRAAEMGGNPDAVRMDEITMHLEGMNQEFVETLLYGNPDTAPKEFRGFMPRFNNLTGTPQSENIINAGGVGADNASILLVGWGKGKVYGGYQKGTAAGLRHIPIGLETAETTAGLGGTRMRVYRDQLVWNCGLVVEDWRFIARACNIDVSLAIPLTGADLVKLMIQLIAKVPDTERANFRFYMPKTLKLILDLQERAQVSAGGGLNYENVDGKRVAFFQDIPVRALDSMSLAETLVA